ncbi:MAG: c-type cytochrome [Lysobacterales bacterium]|jgi:mono/diheme cytochrome c family protein
MPTALVQAANSTAGKALYDKHCAFCHGINGLAETPVGRILNPRPRRFADSVEMARLSDDQIYHAIKSGVPGTAMASWGKVLSEREIGDVMDYIRELRGTSKPMTRQQLSLAVGRRIYDKECAFCHGLSGHADTDAARVLKPRPSNFADPIAMARIDDARIYAAIKLGRPGTAMASWGTLLTPVEIIDVMRYIRSLQEPLPKGISPERAEIAVGRNVYSTYCVNCHGPSGKADTPLGHVLSPRPRNFTDRSIMAQLSDEQMTTAIGHGKPGTAMAPWGGILSAEDIKRVIRYIRATFTPPQGDGQAGSAR